MKRLIPIQINNTPDNVLHIFSGILEMDNILLPNTLPIDKNTSWKVATKIGNKKELYPIILLQIPIHKESIERHNPK